MERCTSAFKNAVKQKCYAKLAIAGFIRYRKDEVDFPLDNVFHTWAGLSTGLYDECVRVNPMVGLHVVPIMKLFAKILGRKYSRSDVTYSIPMGELVPRTRGFAFTLTTNVEEEAARLAQLYIDVGVPYARTIASYDVLLPLLESQVSLLGGYPEKVACCLFLMGRYGKAREFVEEFLERDEDYTRRFLFPFLEMLPS